MNDKKRKALLQAKKRRADRPRPVVQMSRSLVMKNGERDRYTNRHAKYLLAIEATIARCYGNHPTLCDRDVSNAMQALIREREPQPEDGPLQAALQETGDDLCDQSQSDVRQIWIDGLRAINTSVKFHCENDPQGTKYLSYVTHFVAKAVG